MSRRKQDYPIAFTKQQLAAAPAVRPVFWWLLGGAVILYLYLTREGGDVETPAETRAKQIEEKVTPVSFAQSLPTAGRKYAAVIEKAAKDAGGSPFLMAAIMEQESNYGEALRPKGPSGVSADGQDRGLMQINKVAHPDFADWDDPYEAIKYAVDIIKRNKSYLASKPKTPLVTVKSGGYANSRGVPAGTHPDPRPLSGDFLLRAAISAYNTGLGNVLQSVAAGMDPDTTTADGAYASGVLRRMDRIISAAAKSA